MKCLICLLCSIFICFPSFGQQQVSAVIKGILVDLDTRTPLQNGTISLLSSGDSLLLNKTFSLASGAFNFSCDKPGSYIVKASYLGYEPYWKNISVETGQTAITLDTFALKRIGLTLAVIEVYDARKMMVLKKDTLQYDASFFQTRENAKLFDLFKKVPGIRVLKDGSVEVQGEAIKRIMVDGRPYFGNDPGVATRTLPASIIDKIQVIDMPSTEKQDKSVGNAETEKVINITLKKEERNKIFGDIMAAGGTDGRFGAAVNLNKMGEHEQITILARGNNINNYVLSGPGAGAAVNNIGDNGGGGISRNWIGGLNYNRDINSNLKLNISYQYNHYKNDNDKSVERQNILPDTSFNYYETVNSSRTMEFQTINTELSWNIDSLNSLVTTLRLTPGNSKSRMFTEYFSNTPSGKQLNSGSIFTGMDGRRLEYVGELRYFHKFRKARRSLQADFFIRGEDNNSTETSESQNLFFDPNGDVVSDSIYQQNLLSRNEVRPALRVTYSEPIGKSLHLDLIYNYAPKYGSSGKASFSMDPVRKIYSVPVDSLSNRFDNTNQFHLPGLAFGGGSRRLDYAVGALLQLLDMKSTDLTSGQVFNRSFKGIIPSANLNLMLGQNKRIRFNYQGSPMAPDITLLQPVLSNSNPLYIAKGNPDLKPTFSHFFRLSFNNYNTSNYRNVTAQVTGQFLADKVVNATSYDSIGRTVSQPVNVNGSYYLYGNLLYNRPFKEQKGSFESNSYFKTARDVNFVNGLRSSTNSFILSQQLTLNHNAWKSFDWSAGTLFQYEGARYPLQKAANTNFLTWSASLNSNLYLPLGLSLGFDLDYLLTAGRGEGYNLNIVMLNAYLCKTFLEGKRGEVKLQGFDLFNQNNGIQRTVAMNFIEDTRTRVLQRFFMLSFTYYLKKVDK